MIVNPRGTSGSGKTELVRRILAAYGWARGAGREVGGIEPIYRPGRSRPFAYRLTHPFGRRPLVVLGHYEATSGGCDTIRVMDGGVTEVMQCASRYGSDGHDVIIEGLRLSSEVDHSIELARSHDLHVLRLNTPVEQCVRNLVARRRARRDAIPAIARATEVEHGNVEDACKRLEPHARVEVLAFDEALSRAQDLLGIVGMGEHRPASVQPGSPAMQ